MDRNTETSGEYFGLWRHRERRNAGVERNRVGERRAAEVEE